MLYFTDKNNLTNVSYEFNYDESLQKVVCIFNEEFSFPVDILPEDLKEGYSIFIMGYDFTSLFGKLLYKFEITNEFIIDLKAHLKFYDKIKKEPISMIS
ncbi:hypothetical protein V4D30_01050 [Thermodesulfovibrio sp. 3907-1M]|uniref:Uncharacterized protein n=1 Tax=Thermodesulfovibrio autotrophicus TaxID=3118333 RepID=A0AAU8GWI8_9BACT